MSMRIRIMFPLVALGLMMAACAPSTAETTTTTTRPTLPLPQPPTPSTTPSDASFTIIMDGWSVAALPSTQVELSDGTSVGLRPMSESEIAALPAEVQVKLLGRLHSADRGWACDETACVSGNGVAAFHSHLSSPATIPVFGEVYEAAGVNHGVYSATVKLPSASRTVVSVGGWSIQQGALSDVTSGSHVVLSAGLGVVFPLTPLWATTADEFYRYDTRVEYPVMSDDGSRAVQTALLNGLADASASEHLISLDPSELTFMTSLPMGCGSAVICSIEQPDVAVHTTREHDHTACFEEFPIGRAGIFQRVVTVDLPHPTFLFPAMMKGADLSALASPADFDALLRTPRIVSGSIDLYLEGVQMWVHTPSPAGDVDEELHPTLVTYLAFGQEVEPSGFELPAIEEVAARLLPDFASLCVWEPEDTETPAPEVAEGAEGTSPGDTSPTDEEPTTPEA